MLTINQLNIKPRQKDIRNSKNNSCSVAVSNSINSNNINNLNYFNKSLISFKGESYYKTLNDNYFNLPIDKSSGKPFRPDIYQKAAAENLYKGNDVIVTAPTGTGKTAIAHYVINKNIQDGKKTFYTTPLKALSNDKIREFQKIYGIENVGLITGDKKVNKDAPIVIMTTEVYRNMVVKDKMEERNPILDNLQTVVFDELHYLGDNDRGGVWEQAIMFTDPEVQILSLSGTMANPEKITDWMASIKGHEISEKVTPNSSYRAKNADIHTVMVNVPSENRHVPLEFEVINVKPTKKRGGGGGSKADRARAKAKANQIAQSDSAMPSKESYVDVVTKLQNEDKLPAIFFIFSKREGRATLSYLKENAPKLTTNKESQQIKRTVQKYKNEGKYLGETIDYEALEYGYALHNAGMLPEQKELVEELFQKKLLKAVISTETLSAGINMPARSTVISGVRKPTDNPDGDDRKRYLSPNEFHQMAGRAGRRGIDTVGYCFVMASNKSQQKKFDELINTPSNDIDSHFKIDYSFVANANDTYRDKDLLKPILKKSLCAYDEDSVKRQENADNMLKEFTAKEHVLKYYDYLDENNNLTDKGILLTKINGYEQIPVIDSITNKDFANLTPVQLAAFAAGLANMESVPKSDFPQKIGEFEFDDDKIVQLTNEMSNRIDDYNKNIYSRQGNCELKPNNNAIKHVYKWAELNSISENSTDNWKELYSGDLKKSIRDEGTLFREIIMTSDLLKQMGEIAETGTKISIKGQERKYYENLSDTIKETLELINREPANDNEITEE
ncbi:MAG: DEAD/DEAH box helicase [Candidatus Gastranaerophilales bacterium]|nr:DEAD/DEAH box helicase [Candidatus Gastranaerophilales bacterium]